jgi:soluble lytic murein transglycosylase
MFISLLSLLGGERMIWAQPQQDATDDGDLADRWVELREEEITPVLLGKNEKRIRAHIKDKSWTKAARLLQSDDPSLRFLRAWLYAQGEKWTEVLTSLQGLEKHSVLSDEVYALTAEAAEALKDHKLAASAGEEVSRVDLSLWRETLRVRGLALRGLERWDDATKIYLTLLESPSEKDRSLARLGLGMTALERGRPEDALRLLKAVDIHHPNLWTSSFARKEAEKLIKKAPELSGKWSDRSLAERVTKIGNMVMKGSQYQRALKALPQLLKTPLSQELKCRALYLQGRSYYKLKKRSMAFKVLKVAIEVCAPIRHEDTPLALYIAGKTASSIDKDELSKTYFTKLFKEYSHRLSDDAAVFLVRHSLAQGKKGLKEAMEVVRSLPRLHPKGDLSSEAIMFVLIEALAQKRLDLASELTALSLQLSPKEFTFHDAGRSTYWRARVLALRKKTKEAYALYEQVIYTVPLTWYALMAYSRLYEVDPKRAQRVVIEALTWRPKGVSLPSGNRASWRWRFRSSDQHWPLMQRALLWMRLGLKKRGRRAFKELSSYENRPDLQWFSAWALDGYGLYHWSHDILRRRLTEYRLFPPYGDLKKHWLIAYPAPFKALVNAAALAEDVESNFIWGVMREESGYAPLIRSSASAVGLLQLIINTAKMMRHKNEPEVTLETLGQPKVNIPLGARYLSWVKRKVGCAWSLVPAGYNAGGGALKRWLKERGTLPLDLFVETIPYEEARWYTKRVNASWITFRSLYGAPKGEPVWPYVSQATKPQAD